MVTFSGKGLWPAALIVVGLLQGCQSSNPIRAAAQAKDPAHAISIPGEPYRISAADLAFGEAQLQQMVHDRPRMAESVTPESAIWKWAARQIAGAGGGSRIEWSPSVADMGAYDVQHIRLARGMHATLQLRSTSSAQGREGQGLSSEELWANLVYELNNAALDDRYDALWSADGASVDRQALELGKARLQYQAWLATAQVHKSIWSQSRLSKANWGESIGTYEQWLDRHGIPTSPAGGTYASLEVVKP